MRREDWELEIEAARTGNSPEGTAARKVPRSVVRSTSTVGLPRESRTSRAMMLWIPPPPPRRAMLDAAAWHAAERRIIALRSDRTEGDILPATEAAAEVPRNRHATSAPRIRTEGDILARSRVWDVTRGVSQRVFATKKNGQTNEFFRQQNCVLTQLTLKG